VLLRLVPVLIVGNMGTDATFPLSERVGATVSVLEGERILMSVHDWLAGASFFPDRLAIATL
jgi:hypothetical protein